MAIQRSFVWRNKGSALISAYLVLAALLIFGSIFFSRTVSDNKIFTIQRERAEAFHLAEAAVDIGINRLKSTYTYTGTGGTPVALGRGEYELNITTPASNQKRIVAYGYIPSKASARAQRIIEVITRRYTPPNFYDNALYSADDITISGTSYTVSGKGVYADAITGDLNNICDGGVCGSAPTLTQDPSVSPLMQFDFAVLRDLAAAQVNSATNSGNNIYTAEDLAANNDFPKDFWYQPPTNPLDPKTGIPNIVYVEGNIEFKNQNTVDKTAGGFYVVVGTNPTVSFIDTGLGGNILVNGCIYTTGTFTNTGGGDQADVNGGIWAGGDIDLGGSINIDYNYDFMMSIKNIIDLNNASGTVQLLSWREIGTSEV